MFIVERMQETDLIILGQQASAVNRKKFPPHLSRRAIAKGCKEGSILQGRIVLERGNADMADVVLAGHVNAGLHSQLSSVRIIGRSDINRAMNGDVVAIQVALTCCQVSLLLSAEMSPYFVCYLFLSCIRGTGG